MTTPLKFLAFIAVLGFAAVSVAHAGLPDAPGGLLPPVPSSVLGAGSDDVPADFANCLDPYDPDTWGGDPTGDLCNRPSDPNESTVLASLDSYVDGQRVVIHGDRIVRF